MLLRKGIRDKRIKTQKELEKLWRSKNLKDDLHNLLQTLNLWEQTYKEECFYLGVRGLLELEWWGKAKVLETFNKIT